MIALGLVAGACSCNAAGPSSNAASGDDASADAFTGNPTDGVSGTRIRVRYFFTSDGQHVPVGLFDAKLGVPCALYPQSNGGIVRCVPYGAPDVYTFSSPSGLLYADPQCTKGVLDLGPGVLCAPPSFAVGIIGGSSAPPAAPACAASQVFSVLSLGPAASTAYAFDASGKCVEQLADSSDHFVRTGAPLPVSSFVAFHEQRVPLVPGLDTFVWIGDDGSRFWEDELFDTAHGSRCTMHDTGSAGVRCLPEARAGVDAYADSACSQPLYALTSPCDGAPPLATYGLTSCGALTGGVFAVGAPYSGPTYASYEGGCGSNGPATAGRLFTAGAGVDLSALPGATRVPTSNGRLQRDQYFVGGTLVGDTASVFASAVQADGSPSFPLPMMRDTVENVTCRFQLDPSGAHALCIPGDSLGERAVSSGAIFADAACQQLAGFRAPATSCGPMTAYGVIDTGTACAPAQRFYRLGAAQSLASAYAETRDGDPTSCKAIPPVSPPQDVGFLAAGPQVTLAAATVAVE